MRCISLHQPWASLMVHGLKRIETRGAGWGKLLATPGPLLIHAAKKWPIDVAEMCLMTEPYRSAVDQILGGMIGRAVEITDGRLFADWFEPKDNPLPFGAIIGAVEVVAVLDTNRVKWNPDARRYFAYDQGGNQLVISSDEKAFGDYSDGRVAIVTRNPKAFRTPIPYVGRQSLFDVPEAVVADAMAASLTVPPV